MPEIIDRGSLTNEEKLVLADSLQVLQADEHVLAMALKALHWNTSGLSFYALHQLYDSQYEQVLENIDKLGEMIRQLEHIPLSTLIEITGRATVQEDIHMVRPASMPSNQLSYALGAHEHIMNGIRSMLIASEKIAANEVKMLLEELLSGHSKMAFFLRSSIQTGYK